MAATLVVTGAGFVSYQKVLFPKGNALSDMKTVQKLNYLEELIDEEYLDEKDESSLREGLYAGLLSGLQDPYSTYYTAEQYKELNTSNEGSYVGIGAVLQKDNDGGATVVQLYEGGPGEQAGLKTGDVIKAIDGTDVTEKETSDIASMVRDSEKDSVTLTIQRENEEKTQDIKVEIRDVEIQTVSHEMLSGDTGYIRISEFSEVTSDQYKKAFADLKSQGMKKLVVDLRDNPGGLLNTVCDILRQILPEGLIVYTEDKNGKREEETCDGKNETGYTAGCSGKRKQCQCIGDFCGSSEGLRDWNHRRDNYLWKRRGADHPATYRWQCGKDYHREIFYTKGQ